MEHRVSLCICTMNRPEELRRMLASLENSRVPPHEVLVSDDSRGELAEKTRAVVAAFPHVKYLRGPCRGLSSNRNNILNHVQGDLVAFVDDDEIVHPDFLGMAIEGYVRLCATHGTGKIIVTGSYTLPSGVAPPRSLGFLCFYTGKEVDGHGPSETVVFGCALFPAKLFEEARFDEKISFNCEDSDLCYHAAQLGYRIFYIPGMTNDHWPSPLNRDLYDDVVLENRFYFGFKRYWIYQKSLPRFVLFNVYGLANAVGHCLKRLEVRRSFAAIGSFLTAWKLFLSSLREMRARS